MTGDLFQRLAERALSSAGTVAPAIPPFAAVEPPVAVDLGPVAAAQVSTGSAETPDPASRPATTGPTTPTGVAPVWPEEPPDRVVASAHRAEWSSEPASGEAAGLHRPTAPRAEPRTDHRTTVPRPGAGERIEPEPAAPTTSDGAAEVVDARPTALPAVATVFARPRMDTVPPPVPDPRRPDPRTASDARVHMAPPAPVVEVTIDRVELRMARPAPASRAAASRRPGALSLEDYLARRDERLP